VTLQLFINHVLINILKFESDFISTKLYFILRVFNWFLFRVFYFVIYFDVVRSLKVHGILRLVVVYDIRLLLVHALITEGKILFVATGEVLLVHDLLHISLLKVFIIKQILGVKELFPLLIERVLHQIEYRVIKGIATWQILLT
jgi:hypothetical protein